ncbi:MAG: hypothetical protein ACREPI_00915 [Candidatus Dormibacterales bacterium]
MAFAFLLALALRVGAADGFRYLRPIQAGREFARPGVLLPGQRPLPRAGYDGQFYFYIAEDPFLGRPATAASLDNTLRYRRILYPLLAWAVSGGRRSLVPYALVAINVAAGAALVALCAWFAARNRRSPWWALTLAVFSGVWISVFLDLTEPLQLLLLAAGMVAGSAGLLLLSALAKETAAAALVTEFLRGAARRDVGAAARAAAALAVLAGWALFVALAVRGPHESTLGGHFLQPVGAPFILLVREAGSAPAAFVLLLAGVLLCLAAVARLVYARDPPALAAAAYALICLGAGADTWVDPTAYYRVEAGAVVLVFLSWCLRGDRLGRWTLVLAAATGVVGLIPVVGL